MKIRPEHSRDVAAVFQVNSAAFETDMEARLVDHLRAEAQPLVSLVAEVEDAVIGHILFSPVTLDVDPNRNVMGLAPMAVQPGRQSQGVGSALVREGLNACRDLGCVGLIVLGHPDYYPRFGFQPASTWGLRSTYEVPDEVFMALELVEGGLNNAAGLARYHAAFDGM